MPIIKKILKDASKNAGSLVGNHTSLDSQNATNAAVEGMELFRNKAIKTRNVPFEQAKGNLFEYIEAAKFNRNSMAVGSTVKAVVTDSVGDPHAADDIILQEQGKVVKRIQAKFSQTYKNGKDTSAATSVFEQTGIKNKGAGQYEGMDRLIRKQDHYNTQGSLLDEAKKLSKNRGESNDIYSEQFRDVYKHLTDETHYNSVTSGGTTIEEVREAYNAPRQFSRRFEHKPVRDEIKVTAINMAKASYISAGIASGITNLVEMFKDEKSLSEALRDVGSDAIKGGVRGGATGILSTAIRYQGLKAGSDLLSDSTAATVMAGGVIDGGVALYSYAKGEITAEQLLDELVDTTAKATTTIFYTKAVTTILGKAVNPIIPMAVYTTASYVINCTREIIRSAKLNIEEYERLTAIYQESTKVANKYHEQFKQHIALCEESQRKMLNDFIDDFNYNLETGDNYDNAFYAIVRFANHAGIILQHTDFHEFKDSMCTDEDFILK